MLLRQNISLVEFLRMTNRCAGDVYFLTDDGDRLNLKSELAKYLFLSLVTPDDSVLLQNGKIYCNNADDYHSLKAFLIEE